MDKQQDLEFYEEIGWVWTSSENNICLEDHIDPKMVTQSIKGLSQITLLLLVAVPQGAEAKVHTFQDLKQAEAAQNARELHDFYKKIEETIQENLKKQFSENPSGTTIVFSPTSKIAGPSLIPFHQIAQQKQAKLANKKTQQLLLEMEKNNRLLNQTIFTLRGGIGFGMVVEGFKKAKQVYDVSQNILDDKNKRSEEQENVNHFANTIQKVAPFMPILLILAFFYPPSREKLPGPIKDLLPFREKKKSRLRRVYEAAVDFNTPVPYVLVGVGVVGIGLYIKQRQPESTMGKLLSKMIDQTHSNLASFSKLTHDLFNDNLKRFKDVQRSSDEYRETTINDLKKRNGVLESENFTIREKFHDLQISEVKSKHLLEDCSKKINSYGELIEQHKNYYSEVEAEQLNNQKLIDGPAAGGGDENGKKTYLNAAI